MEDAGIEKTVFIYPTTDAASKAGLPELEIARLYNDGIAALVKRYPGRFIGAAFIPAMPEQAMLDELSRAVDELGLRGVSLASSYDGRYLGDRSFWNFYRRVAERNVPVFIHATTQNPIGYERLKDPLLTPVIEYVFDITACIGKIITSGVLGEFPGLKLVFGHFGGAMPFIRERFDYIYKMLLARGFTEDIRKLPSEYLKRLYVDMSGSCSQNAIMCAVETFGEDHVLWGSDYPAAKTAAASIAAIGALPVTDAAKWKILGGTVRELLEA
jgi:predicted TIM-barrel fold metal-dependent hydrolase